MVRIIAIIACEFFEDPVSNDSIPEHYDETQNTLRMPAREVRKFPSIMKRLIISYFFAVV
jgi:hypothetical protein